MATMYIINKISNLFWGSPIYLEGIKPAIARNHEDFSGFYMICLDFAVHTLWPFLLVTIATTNKMQQMSVFMTGM